MALPRLKNVAWWVNDWPLELVAGVPVVGVMVVSAINYFWTPDKQRLGWAMVVATGWLIVATFIKTGRARYRDCERRQRESPMDLSGCIRVMHGMLKVATGIGDEKRKLRITMYAVVQSNEGSGEPETLEQILPYVGGDGGKPPRTYSIRSGIIGRAARTHQMHHATRQNLDEQNFVDEMVSNWGFSESEARNLSTDRQSWLAVPINGPDSNSTLGVVYLDSSDPKFFTDEVIELVIEGCAEIAKFVHERYA